MKMEEASGCVRMGGGPPLPVEEKVEDPQRHEHQEPVDESEIRYAQLLAEALASDLDDVHATHYLRITNDGFGRKVLLITPAVALAELSPDASTDQMIVFHRLLLHFVRECDQIVGRDYVIVYAHTYMSYFDRSRFGFLLSFYQQLPRKFKKNLKQLFVLHSTFSLRMLFEFARLFISEKFYKKLVFVSRLEELYGTIPATNLELPNLIDQYEANPYAPLPQTHVTTRRSTTSQAMLKSSGGGFGSNLISAFDSSIGCPPFVLQCLTYLEQYLDVEGLFRVAGDEVALKDAKRCLNAGGTIVLLHETNEHTDTDPDTPTTVHLSDPNTVAQLLKAYFREMPEPLFPFESYSHILTITRESSDQPTGWALRMREIANDLPEEHYSTSKALITFLQKVVEHESTNRMSAQALSVVFAPNLLRNQNPSPLTALVESGVCDLAIRLLITHCDAVFP